MYVKLCDVGVGHCSASFQSVAPDSRQQCASSSVFSSSLDSASRSLTECSKSLVVISLINRYIHLIPSEYIGPLLTISVPSLVELDSSCRLKLRTGTMRLELKPDTFTLCFSGSIGSHRQIFPSVSTAVHNCLHFSHHIYTKDWLPIACCSARVRGFLSR